MMRSIVFALALLGTAGCVTPTGDARVAPGPDVGAVRNAPGSFVGAQTTWGGRIVAVRNRPAATDLEVLALPLNSVGRPRDSDASPGRFKARVPGFLDPGIYRPERLVSVTGTIAEPETGEVGEYPYRYPVIEAGSHHLWPEQKETQVIYMYEPWFNSSRLNRGYWRVIP